MNRTAALVFTIVGATVLAASQAAPPGTDAAFAAFFAAQTPAEQAAASEQIVASGVPFDEVSRRLKNGRPYSPDVPRGIVQGSYRSSAGEFFYTLDVPPRYDQTRRYQVRVQLHGGVDRLEEGRPRTPGTGGRLPGAEQIYVMPYAWRSAPWWSALQVDNVNTILDRVKREYNVDENRIALSGVSDGATGAYYLAMRNTTPFASVLPLNGFIMVLANETPESDGDLFPHNLVNKPLFVVNGGRDPLYPTSTIEPYINHLRSGGVAVTYLPQPDAGHDTAWWPAVQPAFDAFVAEHPRRPLPDTVTWESGQVPSRAHWVIIERLASREEPRLLPDLNRMTTPATPGFGVRASGTRINRVLKGSNAEQIGLRSGDVVVRINNQPTPAGTDVAEVVRNYPPGRPLLLGVTRGGETLRISGRYAPSVLAGEGDSMFPRQQPSGRVDLVRHVNRVEATTSGVAAFRLLLSPDQFDFNQRIAVQVNGRTVHDDRVREDVGTLLRWAARDNDRTMLFGAELLIEVP
jgi:hypothetical protein